MIESPSLGCLAEGLYWMEGSIEPGWIGMMGVLEEFVGALRA
jgi:hypothetical protein